MNDIPEPKVPKKRESDRLPGDLKSWIFKSIGMASVSWTETPTSTFDSTKANEIGEQLSKVVADQIDGLCKQVFDARKTAATYRWAFRESKRQRDAPDPSSRKPRMNDEIIEPDGSQLLLHAQAAFMEWIKIMELELGTANDWFAIAEAAASAGDNHTFGSAIGSAHGHTQNALKLVRDATSIGFAP